MKAKRSHKARNILCGALLCVVLAAAAFYVIRFVPFGDYDLSPQEGTTLSGGKFSYDLPLDTASPWPKFRANTLQNGRTPVEPKANPAVAPWEYKTEKGIFSTPVVGADGTTYVGSGDCYFYAIDIKGKVKWKVKTGEVIDSSALLDDKGRIYFGSGDAKVYCLNRETGEILWTRQAASTQEVCDEFGIQTYNVNWFEGNIGIMPDGSLLAPNDNYLLYRLNRDSGAIEKRYLSNEMIWSLPSINPKTGKLFFGSIYNVANNILSFDEKSGEKLWQAGSIGATAATTMLTSYKENGGVIVGSFNGGLRCLAQDSGKVLWKTELRDHIYASPAQLSDGTVVQPSADGSVYGINPENGEIKWAFDTLEPIRSSPAVDANDQIYFGSGEGKLFCLNKDGSLRWSYQCILEDRNDLNSSPALGYDGVYIAGESGEIFFVPYDYPLRAENAGNERCKSGVTAEKLPESGGHLIYTNPLGGVMTKAAEKIEANHSVTFTLLTRENNQTVYGQIDPKTLKVTVPGNADITVQISADRRFLIVMPKETWVPDANGNITVNISGDYKTNQKRFGLLHFWGKQAGKLEESFTFALNKRGSSENPFVFPAEGGNQKSTLLELRRQAAPNPSMLPSLAQIGFDSLHYLSGAVSELNGQTLFWIVSGKRLEDGIVVPDPAAQTRIPLYLDYKDGLATFTNYQGFKLNFVATWDVPITSFRIAAAFDPATRQFDRIPTYNVTANCNEIEFYGPGMKLMGISELNGGLMYASGSLEIEEKTPVEAPENVQAGAIARKDDLLRVEISGNNLRGDAHVYGLLVVDRANKKAVPFNYTHGTTVVSDASGAVTAIELDISQKGLMESGKTYDVYVMVDTYPIAQKVLTA